MKKLLGNIKKKSGSPDRNGSPSHSLPQGDSPEAVVVREVTSFCESGAPNSDAAGEEYLHLPAIVDAAESSPAAAKEAAVTIRRYLSKEHYHRGFAQYNAIMLLRILTDNPAHAFTQNFDAKFVSTVKELLREGKDTSVQQILRETLDYMEFDKAPGNDSLGPLMEMWKKEKGKRNALRPTHGHPPAAFAGRQQQQPRRRDTLPPPDELVGRIEEAKTTARLLVQTVQSTPQAELLANDLVKEFADRARAAQKSIQSYMNAQDPAPDPDTMLTLIETNDQLNIAMSKHQRAVLAARKATGLTTPSPAAEPQQNPMSMPQHVPGQNVYADHRQAHPQLSDHGPYSASPPRRQNTIPTPVSPLRREEDEHFAPPPGPPPGRAPAQETQAPPQPNAGPYDFSSAANFSNQFSAPAPPPSLPTRSTARPQSHVYTSSGDFGVAENPFADDAYGPGTPQRPAALFSDRNADTPSPRPAQGHSANPHVHELPSEHDRPGPYNAGYQPTPSYMHRQELSAEQVTMHGGGPSPAATVTNGSSSHPQGGMYGSHPSSPVDDTQAVGRRMNDMHI
ncbi:hypothetical protein G647_08868 [Cladophialophora carrionii CBS 160.54]|uniref:GAT domain-containing protein n=1 Tax=Cladophialophora carrionii CBS 160.54 TaxID=1279043 RepID=V9CYZ7_9EURO|nr:uncharacterized protein G647_08868 [Cladophialophora carrionii CBS 160.54]ETI19854.1 hypothetical protein G647_08868 [Cladophialophora carrionii CBS 160.54]